MLHLDGAGPDTPRLPRPRLGAAGQVAAAAFAHAGALTIMLVFGLPEHGRDPSPATSIEQPCLEVPHIVFLATDPRPPGSGGGGGGNHGEGPIRRAEGVGADAITLRTRKSPPPPVTSAPRPSDMPPLPSITVDAMPLVSGTFEQTGLPSVAIPAGTSTGSGSGGGVGSGVGTGIGSGQGPGLGRGAGGGTGGGVFRAGGAVTAPRVIMQVRPKYTNDALLRHIQGTVELELVVARDGRPSQIRVVRSLDAGGLDDEAVAAVALWRFEPGRNAGTPVDVLVTALLDFWIR